METNNNKWQIFIVVAAGVFMSTMDSSMVNIALPTIMQDFQSPLKSTEWVVLIYLLTITSSLLIWGTLSDRLGRHRIYPTGLFIFSMGSMACAFSPTLPFLVGSRLGQALGAGMMMSTGPAVIKETFPGHQLGRGLGMVSISVSLGLMAGPAVGGFLLEFYSWRALFWISVPIGLFFTVLGIAKLPASKPDPASGNLNWSGALVWIALLCLTALAVTHASSPSWSPTILAGLVLAALLALAVFCQIQSRAEHPLLPRGLINRRFFWTALVCAALSFLVLFTVLILTPFYLDRVMTISKARIGMIMMTIPVVVLFIGPAAGWMSEHIPAKKLATTGLLISTTGTILLSRLSAHSTTIEIIAKLAVLGCGQALFLAPNSASVLKRIERQHTGKSASLLATARNLGMLLGIGLASMVFSHNFGKLTGGLDMMDFKPQHTEAFMSALQVSFLAAAVFGALGSMISWQREKSG